MKQTNKQKPQKTTKKPNLIWSISFFRAYEPHSSRSSRSIRSNKSTPCYAFAVASPPWMPSVPSVACMGSN